MPESRPVRRAPVRRRLCLHCLVLLTDDEREHYVYACHACVEDEHDAATLARRDPGHPDATWSSDPPVLIGPARRIRTRRTQRAA